MTAMLAVPADMHIKAYAILPSDAAIILGLSRISWPKSYPKGISPALSPVYAEYVQSRVRCTA